MFIKPEKIYRKQELNGAVIPPCYQDINRQIVQWESDWKAVPFWKPYNKNFRYNHEWFVSVISVEAMRNAGNNASARLLDGTRWLEVSCEWESAPITTDTMYVEDLHVTYYPKVATVGGVGDMEAQHIRGLEEAFKVRDWLMTNPVVDGLHLSQHRWNLCAAAFRAKHFKELSDEQARMADPTLTPKQVKQLLESIKAKGDYQFKFVGRAGTRAADSTYGISVETQYCRGNRRSSFSRLKWYSGHGHYYTSTFDTVKREAAEFISTTSAKNRAELETLGVKL